MSFDPVVMAIPLFFFLMILELIFNWFRIKKKEEDSVYRLNDALTNIGCGVLDQITGVFSKVIVVGAYAFVYEATKGVLRFEIPNHWVWYVILFFLVDFFYYLAHRWSHQVNLMWAGHVVHHQSEEYNLSVALRQGAVQKLMTFWVYFPLAIVGFKPEWFLISLGLNLIYQFWIHTELIEKLGWFELIFNTPSHHRVHHGKNPKYLDKNHGGVLIIWDRLMGTFQEEEERPTYGITNPTLTFNPVKAHVQPIQRLFKGVSEMDSIKKKFQFVFRSPDWVSKNLLENSSDIKVSQTKKFDYPLISSVKIYLFVQFVVNMGVGAILLEDLSSFDLKIQLLVFFHAVLYLLSIGLVFDNRSTGFTTEVIRHFLNASIGIALILNIELNLIGFITVLFSVISLIWFVFVKRKMNE